MSTLKKKQILHTFDYELFLGKKSGTIQNCLIKPTNLLLQLFKQHNFKGAVFFVDTTYLAKISQQTNQNCLNDFNTIASQLVEIVAQGHYVYPHIHPHWLDASYIKQTNEWDLSNYSKYRFALISNEEKQLLFDDSIAVLTKILKPIFPNYKIDGYRAGGWCIQPFTDFIPFFKKYNIKYEFSVLSGHADFTKAHYFNFSETPDKNIYCFEDEVCVENRNGQFKQFSISSVELTTAQILKEKLFLKYLRFKKINSFGDGIGLVLNTNEERIDKPNHFLEKNNLERVSVELLNPSKFYLYKNFIDNNDYMHFISHPKMISTVNLKSLNKFMHYVAQHYYIVSDFKKF